VDPVTFMALFAVAFLASVVQASTGFGFAILAVPFFLMIMGSLSAIQVTAAINFVISLVLLHRLIKDASYRLLLHLIAGSVAGFPVGLAAFRAADLNGVKLTVGALITVFALLLLVRDWRGNSTTSSGGPGTSVFEARPVPEVGVGFVSGVMAVALAMPGPAVVLYLLVRHAGKQASRAATLLLFGFSYGAVSLVHTVWGDMSAATWLLAAKLTPAVIAGAIIGHFATRYLSEDRFRAIVLMILIVSGVYGVWTAL
jgi:uncharacterized membrane protein YfcA